MNFKDDEDWFIYALLTYFREIKEKENSITVTKTCFFEQFSVSGKFPEIKQYQITCNFLEQNSSDLLAMI